MKKFVFEFVLSFVIGFITGSVVFCLYFGLSFTSLDIKEKVTNIDSQTREILNQLKELSWRGEM